MSERLLARLSASWLTGFAFAAALLFTHAAPATGGGQDVNPVTHWPVASRRASRTVPRIGALFAIREKTSAARRWVRLAAFRWNRWQTSAVYAMQALPPFPTAVEAHAALL